MTPVGNTVDHSAPVADDGKEQLAQTGAASSGMALAAAATLAGVGTGALLYARRRTNS